MKGIYPMILNFFFSGTEKEKYKGQGMKSLAGFGTESHQNQTIKLSKSFLMYDHRVACFAGLVNLSCNGNWQVDASVRAVSGVDRTAKTASPGGIVKAYTG